MGIWSSFLDFLWPVAAKKPEPEPDLDARAAEWRRALRQSVDEMMAEHRAKAGKATSSDEAVMRDLPSGVISVSGATFGPVAGTWREWPVEQWAPKAERTLRRITGSRRLKAGGNSTKPRAVISADGTRYPSVRAAAKARGVATSTVWDQVAEGRGGWRYAD